MNRSGMPRADFARPLRVGIYYVSVAVFFFILWLFNCLCVVTLPLYEWLRPRRRVRLYLRWWVGAYLWLLRLSGNLRLSHRGFDALPEMTGTLLVANHPSLLDAFLLLALSQNIIVVYKATLHNGILSKATTRLTGYIANDSGRQTIRDAATHLAAGRNVLLFPEGTRTSRWPLLPLNKGYTLMAKGANAPIRVVSLSTRSDVLSKAASLFRCGSLPAVFELSLSEPLYPSDFADVDALNDHIESMLRDNLADAYSREFAFPMRRLPATGQGDVLRAEVAVPNDPAFCEGHFPGDPVLPAYAILLLCVHCAERLTGTDFSRRSWSRVKFSRPIRPGASLEIRIVPGADGFTITLSEAGVAAFVGRLQPI